MENDQAKVAMREEAPEPGSAALTMPSVSELGGLVTMFPAGETPIVVMVRVSVRHEFSE
jgi:hypothetical protein